MKLVSLGCQVGTNLRLLPTSLVLLQKVAFLCHLPGKFESNVPSLQFIVQLTRHVFFLPSATYGKYPISQAGQHVFATFPLMRICLLVGPIKYDHHHPHLHVTAPFWKIAYFRFKTSPNCFDACVVGLRAQFCCNWPLLIDCSSCASHVLGPAAFSCLSSSHVSTV
jgi:hypothetical protein